MVSRVIVCASFQARQVQVAKLVFRRLHRLQNRPSLSMLVCRSFLIVSIMQVELLASDVIELQNEVRNTEGKPFRFLSFRSIKYRQQINSM